MSTACTLDGPFCRHWSEVGCCDELCARPGCGHGCGWHSGGCYECDCPSWVEAGVETEVTAKSQRGEITAQSAPPADPTADQWCEYTPDPAGETFRGDACSFPRRASR